jgi:hypothetical protein
MACINFRQTKQRRRLRNNPKKASKANCPPLIRGYKASFSIGNCQYGWVGMKPCPYD